jgi:hypothetical protein
MKRTLLWTTVVATGVAALAGCAQVPKPSAYPYTLQQHMQAAEHWKILAAELAGNARDWMVSSGANGAVAVQTADASPFGSAFRGFLVTELMAHGIAVATSDDAPLRIGWDVQQVRHLAPRSQAFPGGWIPAAFTTAVVGALVDVAPAFETGRVPQTEIIVTSELRDVQNRVVVHRRSDVFYINDLDSPHYRSYGPAASKAFTVTDR